MSAHIDVPVNHACRNYIFGTMFATAMLIMSHPRQHAGAYDGGTPFGFPYAISMTLACPKGCFSKLY